MKSITSSTAPSSALTCRSRTTFPVSASSSSSPKRSIAAHIPSASSPRKNTAIFSCPPSLSYTEEYLRLISFCGKNEAMSSSPPSRISPSTQSPMTASITATVSPLRGFRKSYIFRISLKAHYINKSSIRTSFWTMPEYFPRATPNVVTIVKWTVCLGDNVSLRHSILC